MIVVRMTFLFPALRGWLLFFLALIGVTLSGYAQITVDVSFQRSLYIRYEPMICTVSITNLSGRTLELTDTDKQKWFSFQIETQDGRPLPPIDPDYRNEPMTIQAGQKVARSINLTPLFPMAEFGLYRVQASIYSEQLKGFFVSPKLNVEITEGRKLWTQEVGVPDGAGEGDSRTYTLLAHRLSQHTALYVRVEDEKAGRIYCTSRLGSLIAFSSPDVMLDSGNQLHILQNSAPKAFIYTQVNLNGKVVKQQGYQAGATRPNLVKGSDGSVAVTGGTIYDPNATPPEEKLPKLSDRPVPLPGPAVAPTPEDKRPEHLLSN